MRPAGSTRGKRQNFATAPILVEGDADDAKALAKADAAVRSAEDRVQALSDALGVIAGQAEDLQRSLADERDRAAREQAASERERAADAVEAVAVEIERGVEALAANIERLVGIIP